MLLLLLAAVLFLGAARLQADDSATTSPRALLHRIAAELSARWKVHVLVEPDLAPATTPGVPAARLPLDTALDTTLAPLRRVTWRRVYLAAAPDGSLPSPETLAAAARALERLEPNPLVVEDPETRRLTACLRDPDGPRSRDALLRLGKLDARPVYLIYRTTAPPEPLAPERRFADLQRQQLALPIRPEHRAQAMLRMMHLLQQMPPADREQFMHRTLQAGTRLWDSTPPEQRREMIQQSLQLMKQHDAALRQRGAGPTDTGRRAAGRREPGEIPPPTEGVGGNQPPALRARAQTLAAALTRRYEARFLVEPDLFIAPPVLPDATLPAEKALTEVAAAIPGTAGRRLYLTDAKLERLPSTLKLAAVAREIEALAPVSLLLENPTAKRATFYLRDQPPSSLPALLERGKLSEAPLHLLYSATPSARGDTPEERVADLQRQQLGWMLQMSPDQMAQSMEPVIRSFSAADPDTRARLMGLPSMAGLMAVWFPREAKESGPPLGAGNP